MHGGVEEPARPGGIVRREAGAVVEDVVDAGQEVGVHGGLDIAQGGVEMLVQPGGGLGGGERLVGHMGGRGGGLHADDAAALRLGDVAHAVQVQDVGGGAVGLVADALALPGGPLLPEPGVFLAEQFPDGLPVVEDHAVLHLRVARGAEQFGHMGLEVIAAAGLEFGEEFRGPVGIAPGVVHLVGIVEIVADLADVAAREGLVELLQVVLDGRAREMVDYIALAAGTGALHELAVPAQEQRADRPVAFRRRPVQRPVRLHTPGQFLVGPVRPVGRHGNQREFQRIAHLLIGVLLEPVVGGDGIAHVLNPVGCADGADHRFLPVRDPVLQAFAALEPELLVGQVAAGIVRADPGAAERPAGSVGQVDAQSVRVRRVKRVGEEVHPGGGEVVEVAVLPSLGAVDRGHFHAAESGGCILVEHRVDVGFAHGAGGPPPAGPGLGLAAHFGPGGTPGLGHGGGRLMLPAGGQGQEEGSAGACGAAQQGSGRSGHKKGSAWLADPNIAFF